ncbi:MAG: hypothetical protein P4L82_08525 [Ancalomicrobiaceae bacterium]|nr:hypothetical protein [Ancalomicrobiaceae bacterium]
MRLVEELSPSLAKRFHIWGGCKILDLLIQFEGVATHYLHYLTPGVILAAIMRATSDKYLNRTELIRYLVTRRFYDQQYTKLEQAGASADSRPSIQELFTEIPYELSKDGFRGRVTYTLAKSVALNHRPVSNGVLIYGANTRTLHCSSSWLIRGGPGQGKSTVTQFLSQVQRAALILANDELAVTPAARAACEEIRAVAERLESWPLAPRIPVYVELRDFAQWIGARVKGEPRGIVSYVCQNILEKAEVQLLPKTLLSALSLDRWMFVFDGLDEVPNDVKGEVSEQVIIFSDQILVENNCDAVIFATSRPQGYSGQFDAMRSVRLDLCTLEAEEAFLCAQPLLRFQRSRDEAEEAAKILAAALESESVKQIMTTPLQAHIMAVVVRDGGRPPERKWQLFENFYRVIKKREANRNLPNKPLANLLNKGDRLIKALHSRIGFELHARAERSGGAQASLGRDDLRSLVRETVCLLQDDHVDETVSLLMEATMERLVLVSTPESSTKVRFDVRPLQEFFASEYVYDVQSSDIFRERFNILLASAHWREVAHFILSALVENGKTAELSIAVSSLLTFDDANGDEELRILRRILGTSALIGSRLLSEGVLEADKRVRSIFRPVLEPLCAQPRPSGLVEGLVPPHSVSWFIGVSHAALREKAESEVLGAAIFLCKYLTLDHGLASSCEVIVNGMSLEFKVALVRLVSESVFRLGTWATKMFFEWTASEVWNSFGKEEQSALALIVLEFSSPNEIAAVQVPLLSRKTLNRVRFNPGDERNRFDRSNEIEEIGRNSISYRYAKPIDDAEAGYWDSDVVDELLSHGGFFHEVGIVASAVSRGDGSIFRERKMCLAWPSGNLQNFVELSYDGTISRLRTDRPGWQRTADFSTTNPAISLRESPEEYLLEICSAGSSIRQYLVEQLRSVGDWQRKLADAVGSIDFSYWHMFNLGSLFQTFPEIETELRGALANIGRTGEGGWYESEIGSFEVRLPMEANALVPLAAGLIGARYFVTKLSDTEGVGVVGVDENSGSWLDGISRVVAKFVRDCDRLFDVAVNNEIHRDIRAAAMSLYLVHPDGSISRRQHLYHVARTLCGKEMPYWFTRAAFLVLHRDQEAWDDEGYRTAAHLLECLSGNSQNRMFIDEVMGYWREESPPVILDEDRPLWSPR